MQQTDQSGDQRPGVVPDAASKVGKKAQVAEMFDGIARRYDFLNHLLSLGIDKGWRKKAIREVAAVSPKDILDVATGTGDMAIAAHKAIPTATITGADISEGMLEVGRRKVDALGLDQNIRLQSGDSEHLPFADNAFDAVMCAYGVRNFENLEAGLRDMARVLRPGGKLVILEFSRPQRFPVKQFYHFYFRFVLPVVGKLVSRHSRAYSYLPESVMAFPEGAAFTAMLERSGYEGAKARALTFGITMLYTAVRR